MPQTPSRSYAHMLLALLSIMLIPPMIEAQQTGGLMSAEERMRRYDAHVAMKTTSMFKNYAWHFLGPTNTSGRMTDIAVIEPRGESYTIYVAGASGGVWRTSNEGTTWVPVFQHAASTSIGDVTVAPSDPQIIWVGTGEANIFRSSMAGSGIYKSTDAGESWTHMGLTDTHTIPRVVVHPEDPDIVYVAASGHEWTDNEERGVYKSTDGGESWEKALYINDRTGAIDLIMHPEDPDTLYAATWQRIRYKWSDPRNEPDYDTSGIYTTTDGGRTWRPVNDGLPEARYRGRIGIDIARSNPNVLYAFVDNYEITRDAPEGEADAYGRPRGGVIRGATVYRSDDDGEHWRQVSAAEDPYMERASGTYGWVFGQIRVDPNDENTVYFMGLGLNVSNDGGNSWRRLTGMHGDHHGLWIDPENSNYLVNVNDGGVDISYDAGVTWKNFNDNLSLVQFFNLGYDMDEPFNVYGSIQDHGSRRGPVDLSRGRDQIPAVEFENAPGGEGSSHAIDPTDPTIVYSAGFYGTISRTNLKTGERLDLVPQAEEGELPLRGQWIAPFIISPHNPRIIYHGMNFLYRSMDRGNSWERISPDLTYNDVDKVGDIPYQTIFSIAESPFRFGLLYVGTDDGRVWRTRDSGNKWTELTGDLPKDRFIAEIVASAHDENIVYMAQNGKRDDDFTPYLWKSTDQGDTWESIVANIPLGPINLIKEDPENRNLLFVGTDLGVYVSISGGEEWQVLSGGMPTTFVHDLIIHPRDHIMVAATHGRGMWAMDVRELQGLTGEVLAKDLQLFEIDTVVLPNQRSRFREFGDGAVLPRAFIHYYLRSAEPVTVTVRDPDGSVIANLEGTGNVGMNSVSWDLREEGQQGGDGRRGGPPMVRTGSYEVTVCAESATATGTLQVRE